MNTAQGENIFNFPEAFGPGWSFSQGKTAGNIVFIGYGLEAPQWNWDDYAGVDVRDKIVVLLDASLPKEHVLKPEEHQFELKTRFLAALKRGAAAVVTVISEEREKQMAEAAEMFESPRIPRFISVESELGMVTARVKPPIVQIDVRHDAAAAILGIRREDLARLFEEIRNGSRPAAREISGASLEITLAVADRKLKTANVVGWIEGSDPKLKNEYIVIGSHYDHVGPHDGKILPGADDNASGVVGMFEIAEAMMIERPKRSVIFVWHTAEERGLLGAYHFVQNCPVPVEAVSANLNLDMISRNAPDQLYLVGARTVSFELDESIRKANARSVQLKLDAQYDDLTHPEHFFFRSDHYPYIRYGIPGVWFFCGTTTDYHREGDIEEKCDYAKMEKACRLIYLTAMDIGNKPALLKLDADPRIATRGKHNMKIDWMKRGSEPPAKK